MMTSIQTNHHTLVEEVIVCNNKRRSAGSRRAPMIHPWWFPAKTLDPQTFAGDLLFNGASEQSFPRKMPVEA